MWMMYRDNTSLFCNKCGKPYTYVGDVPLGGFPQGQTPWCECVFHSNNPINHYVFCPHCGKELTND